MICHNCGSNLEKLSANLPFNVSNNCIAIIKGLPVLQCRNCYEYLIEDEIMEKIDHLLNETDTTAELKVLSYAG